MKLEKLSKGYFKKFIIILVVIGILGITFMNRSKAKYRVTQSIQIVDGEVNYKVADLNVLALYKQKNKGDTSDDNYESIDKIPISGYTLNTTKSYCTKPSTNDNKITGDIVYNGKSVSINNITERGTKCYVYLDLGTSVLDLLAKYTINNTSDGCPAYEDAPSITSVGTKALLCRGKDDLGDTYYFRGNVTNNWVKLGNLYWRIIRINGNEGVRLIYSGTGSPATSGTGTQIKTSSYNSSKFGAYYVKFKNGSTNSTIKNELDTWYNQNLTIYKDKLDGAAGFCNDMDNGSTSSDMQYYKSYDRIVTSKKPTLKCGTPTTNLYTTTGNANGNQQLDYPIGLITIDEVSFAGGLDGAGNSNYYLYTGQTYWTMSPYYSTSSAATVFSVYLDGRSSPYYEDINVMTSLGVRPVVNLKADILFKDGADGSKENPYVVII